MLEALIKKGVPRFVAYRDVQRVAFLANDKGMFYKDAIKNDKAFTSKLTEKEIDAFSPEKHLGASPKIISNKTARSKNSKEIHLVFRRVL